MCGIFINDIVEWVLFDVLKFIYSFFIFLVFGNVGVEI